MQDKQLNENENEGKEKGEVVGEPSSYCVGRNEIINEFNNALDEVPNPYPM